MSEIKVGEYIRPFDEIEKVTSIDDDFFVRTDKCNIYFPNIMEITKHSHNIIDLIEVGDYVNGCEVMNIYIPNDVWDCIEIEINDKNRRCFLTCEIKSIVTREQFKESEYKVNE